MGLLDVLYREFYSLDSLDINPIQETGKEFFNTEIPLSLRDPVLPRCGIICGFSVTEMEIEAAHSSWVPALEDPRSAGSAWPEVPYQSASRQLEVGSATLAGAGSPPFPPEQWRCAPHPGYPKGAQANSFL